MKNICFFNSISSWGGGEKWHFEMASYMATLNYNVSFVTKQGSALDEKLNNENIKKEYVSVSNFSFLNIFKVNKIAEFLKQNKIDVIIINSSQDLKIGGLAAKKANVKNIIYRRGSAIPIKDSFINRYYFSKVITEIIANSHATKKTINQNNVDLFPENKIEVIPNGIETSTFLDLEIKETFLKNEVFILGNLGRLVKQKNQFFLLEVAKELKLKNLNFKLLIGGDGVLKEKLYQKRKELQLENEVEFVGFVDSPKSFMNKIDVFLLPSLWEGFGYVIAEAMLCEKPVIAFNVSSNPELIIENENGYLTNVNDIDGFVNKILLLYSNRSLIEKMGNNGKGKIIKQFDSSISRDKTDVFVKRL